MSEANIIITETDQGFIDQDGNRYGLISMKAAEEFHTIIQALNEALVRLCTIAKEERGLSHFYWHAEDEIAAASAALARVPEQDRKGGTWRLEE